jgi:hypothetical protein
MVLRPIFALPMSPRVNSLAQPWRCSSRIDKCRPASTESARSTDLRLGLFIHPLKRSSELQSTLVAQTFMAKVCNGPPMNEALFPGRVPHIRHRTWAKKDGRSPFLRFCSRGRNGWAKIYTLAHAVKAFEESVFGPCTLGRTWGTRPEPKTLGWKIKSANARRPNWDKCWVTWPLVRIGIERIRGRSCPVPRSRKAGCALSKDISRRGPRGLLSRASRSELCRGPLQNPNNGSQPKPALDPEIFPRGTHGSRSCNRTDCKRGDDDATTSVLRRRVTRSNFSAKWCGVACIAQLHLVKRTREPKQTVGGSVHLRGRGTQKEKGRVCKALFGGSIPSRASTSL